MRMMNNSEPVVHSVGVAQRPKAAGSATAESL